MHSGINNMKARFIGQLDFSPMDPKRPNEWKLEQDFAFVRDDGVMVIAQTGGTVDGASIPRMMWRLIGHPFDRGNRFWSVPHDAGYRRFAIVVNPTAMNLTPDEMLATWRDIKRGAGFIHGIDLPRRWWDRTLQQAMIAMDEPRWKRVAVYAAVRCFGRRAFRRK